MGNQEVNGSRRRNTRRACAPEGGFDHRMSEVFEHGCGIGEDDAVIVNDHDPQGAYAAVFSSALGHAVALDLGNRQLSQPSSLSLWLCRTSRPPHRSARPCTWKGRAPFLADALRREERLDSPRQGRFVHRLLLLTR